MRAGETGLEGVGREVRQVCGPARHLGGAVVAVVALPLAVSVSGGHGDLELAGHRGGVAVDAVVRAAAPVGLVVAGAHFGEDIALEAA